MGLRTTWTWTLSVTLLAACGQREPSNTVEYYTAHPAERDSRLAVCKANPGALKSDPDCVNAAASVMSGWTDHSMPPVTFGAAASAASR